MSRTWHDKLPVPYNAWRRTRAMVLARDGYVCQLKRSVCTVKATHCHHTQGVHTGLDMRYLVAACGPCNISVGDPLKQPDPPSTSKMRW